MLTAEEEETNEYEYGYDYDGASWQSVPVLKKDALGACVYFDKKNRRCSIYPERPGACKAWFCGRRTKDDETWQFLKT